MRSISRLGRRVRTLPALMLVLILTLASTVAVSANVMVRQLSSDPYTNPDSQHKTEVEPDSFAFGSTIVAATQAGRFYDGGSSNIGWATSTNAGASWTHGFLPGITVYQGGPYDRATDPAVAYDAKHHLWLIVTLAFQATPTPHGEAILVSRSTDGRSWSNPFTVLPGPNTYVDKPWIVCDTTANSLHYGNCYVEWDDQGNNRLMHMSTSSDGGQSWGAQQTPIDNVTGIGGQPVVQPNGTVIVSFWSSNDGTMKSFQSSNGGATWSSSVIIATITDHVVAGSLRSETQPSAEIDGAGKVYVAWHDCRFRPSCTANDIVYSTSTNGTTWSAVKRVPIDATTSGIDHFIPGLAVDRTTSGISAHLGLAYYYYPRTNCTFSTCTLSIGFISSRNGGTTWSTAIRLAAPMTLSYIPDTSKGRMVGDYISTSFVSGKAFPVFSLAAPNTGPTSFHQTLTTVAAGLVP